MYRVGIDTGGTFTDAVLLDDGGNMQVFKSSTTPDDFSIGVMECLAEAAISLDCELSGFLRDVSVIAHGSTVATNAVLTSNGAKVGSISTKGFRDTLELRRRKRPGEWFRKVRPVEPLCPRYLSLEVNERLRYTGEIITPLDEKDVLGAIKIFQDEGVESIAVCLLFSVINAVHEIRIKEIIESEYPTAFISLSSDVLPQLREYERTSTVVLDAYVSPTVVNYVAKLKQRLTEHDFNGEFLLMQSNGGVQSWDLAIKHGIGTLNSGPAAAFPASLYFAQSMDVQDILSVDMGGTSFDVALTKDRTIKTTTESTIAQHRNAYPMVDILTIGSGGGSIAWVNPAGLLKVGPQSAGASPGPACYGRGGTTPTVTDANLILGYLDPEYFLGGRMKVDHNAARAAFDPLAATLGVSVVEAAEAVYTVVNENMGNAISEACVRYGYDPRDFLLVVGGGAGATHAVRQAQKLQIPRMLIPKQAPVYCALGLVLSDLKHDFVRTFFSRLRQADFNHINKLIDEMRSSGRDALISEGISDHDISFRALGDMRYVGQFREIEIELPDSVLNTDSIDEIEAAFSRKHEQLYTYSDPSREIEIVALKGVAIGAATRPEPASQSLEGYNAGSALRTERPVYFSESKDFVTTPIYEGALLKPGNSVGGPAVIEETAMTLPVPPGVTFTVDEFGNYLATIEHASR